jgi:hypothetical protein
MMIVDEGDALFRFPYTAEAQHSLVPVFFAVTHFDVAAATEQLITAERAHLHVAKEFMDLAFLRSASWTSISFHFDSPVCGIGTAGLSGTQPEFLIYDLTGSVWWCTARSHWHVSRSFVCQYRQS